MTPRCHAAVCLGACLAISCCAARATAQDSDAPDAGSEDPAEPDSGVDGEGGPEAPPDGPDGGADPDGEDPGAHSDPVPPPRLLPPRVLSSPPPTYPAGRLADAVHPTVVLLVTLDEHGHVMSAVVEHGADDETEGGAEAGGEHRPAGTGLIDQAVVADEQASGRAEAHHDADDHPDQLVHEPPSSPIMSRTTEPWAKSLRPRLDRSSVDQPSAAHSSSTLSSISSSVMAPDT